MNRPSSPFSTVNDPLQVELERIDVHPLHQPEGAKEDEAVDDRQNHRRQHQHGRTVSDVVDDAVRRRSEQPAKELEKLHV